MASAKALLPNSSGKATTARAPLLAGMRQRLAEAVKNNDPNLRTSTVFREVRAKRAQS